MTMNPCVDSCSVKVQEGCRREEGSQNTIQSAFSSSCGRFDVNGNQFYIVRVLKMKDSTLVFIGEAGAESLDEMAMAMAAAAGGRRQKQNTAASKEQNVEETGDEKVGKGRKAEILSTTLFGMQMHSQSQLLAEQLSRRYQRHFFISCNIKVDPMVEPLFQQKLAQYIKTNIEQFI